MYTHITPTGYARPWDGKEQTGLGAGSESGAETEIRTEWGLGTGT